MKGLFETSPILIIKTLQLMEPTPNLFHNPNYCVLVIFQIFKIRILCIIDPPCGHVYCVCTLKAFSYIFLMYFLFKSFLNLHMSNIDNNLKAISCLTSFMDLLSFAITLINMTQFSFSTSIWIKRWLVITWNGC